jgi:hypothetical protein
VSEERGADDEDGRESKRFAQDCLSVAAKIEPWLNFLSPQRWAIQSLLLLRRD